MFYFDYTDYGIYPILIFVGEDDRFFGGVRSGLYHPEFSFKPHDQYLTGV